MDGSEIKYDLVAVVMYLKPTDKGTAKKMIKFVFRGNVEGYVDYVSIDVPVDKTKTIHQHIKDKEVTNRLGQKIKMVVKNPFLHKVLQEKPDVS